MNIKLLNKTNVSIVINCILMVSLIFFVKEYFTEKPYEASVKALEEELNICFLKNDRYYDYIGVSKHDIINKLEVCNERLEKASFTAIECLDRLEENTVSISECSRVLKMCNVNLRDRVFEADAKYEKIKDLEELVSSQKDELDSCIDMLNKK